MSDFAKVEVVVTDLETGEAQRQELEGDRYLVITSGRLYVAHEQCYPTTGGAQITIKRDDL